MSTTTHDKQDLITVLPHNSFTAAQAVIATRNQGSATQVLTIVQCAAILEIVHAAVRLVRSPLFVTTMQVGSRIVALHMVVNSVQAQSE